MSCIKQRAIRACEQCYSGVQLPGREVGWVGGFTPIDPPEAPGQSNIDAALVGRIPEGILVAIRGTLAPVGSGRPFKEVLDDWLNNVRFQAADEEDVDYPGSVHAGFARSAARLWPDIDRAIRAAIRPGHTQLFVTGHSKGGAVANLIAWRARSIPGLAERIRVYTVAAARAGNHAFRDGFQSDPRIRCVRYESALDIVPHLPLGAETPAWARRLALALWPGLLGANYASAGTRLPTTISWGDRVKAAARAVRLAMLNPNPEGYLNALASAHDIRLGSGYDGLVCPSEEGCAHDRP